MAGSGNNVTKMSPRQRMINLMYIVLTAMLALNVSSDVLNGFAQVHEGLARTNRTMAVKNDVQFLYLKQLYDENPEKALSVYNKGVELRNMSTSLIQTIDSLKTAIAQKVDGPKGNFDNIINQEDLDAAGVVMLNPVSQSGRHLRESIDTFRTFVSALVPNPQKRDALIEMLSTKVNAPLGEGMVTWEDKHFHNMPSIAAVTMLTKIQNDIRQAESEALNQLILGAGGEPEMVEAMADAKATDTKVVVNNLEAYVIPKSTMVMRGGRYSANIVLAAVETTQPHSVYVGGSRINNGLYEFTAGSVGEHQYSGYISVPMADGTTKQYPFTSSYTVVEPMATISPTMMNVLYAGIDNPISISVPGIPMSAINASMTNGTLTRNGNTWIAKSSHVGTEAEISVSATIDGRSQTVGSMKFRVRKLPDPTPYISVGGTQYKGTPKRISKAQLMNASGLSAAIDDGIIDVQSKVLSFSMVFFDQMGNAMPENSNGSSFSQRQIDKIRQLKPGKSFFISNVKATGPDGVTRDISPMEVGLSN